MRRDSSGRRAVGAMNDGAYQDTISADDGGDEDIVDGTSVALRLAPGVPINQYELIRELGRGGMGQIFLARDNKLGRRVALKFLVRRFERTMGELLNEARATARCSHPNIVVVYEVDEYKGMPYLALEYLNGSTLRALIEEGDIPPARAVELIVPVVRALVRAHEFGTIHRDLKPENIFVTDDGTVKVLDFGLATLLDSSPTGQQIKLTQSGRNERVMVGTPMYMAPEQYDTKGFDHGVDVWAVGMMLFEMITGRHPLEGFNKMRLIGMAAQLDVPLPSLVRESKSCPPALGAIVDRCLAKRRETRVGSAKELLDALEPFLPGRGGFAATDDPYPGLGTFEEDDAHRFFGRAQETSSVLARLRDRPLVAVVGPSGAGKSSLIRAGVIPRLRQRDGACEVVTLRPGRRPLTAISDAIEPLTATSPTAPPNADEIRMAPGRFGEILRQRARHERTKVVIFVDQFEELYTLGASPEDRETFLACLSSAADDPASPLRVVLSVRADFLHHVADSPRFLKELTPGLIFLGQPTRAALTDALIKPAELFGVSYESDELVNKIVGELETTAGALPLLQFAARRLWEARNVKTKTITEASYAAVGGVEGTLARHADDVIDSLSPSLRPVVRAIMRRLVTSEGTRDVVDRVDFRQIGHQPHEIEAVLTRLIEARLVVAEGGEDEGGTIELVHEALVHRWPRLRRWLDEDREDRVFMNQLRAAAKQWSERGQPVGLLWAGDAAREALRFQRRYIGDFGARERAFLGAVEKLRSRSTRRKTIAITAIIITLFVVGVASSIGLLMIRNAEKTALDQAEIAKVEAANARNAEQKIAEQFARLEAKEKARLAAEQKAGEAVDRADEASRIAEAAAARADQASRDAEEATAAAASGQAKLKLTYSELERALRAAQEERARAQEQSRKAANESRKAQEESRRAQAAAEQARAAAESERKTRRKLERALADERERRGKIKTTLD